jgi:hypothetical protein
MLRLLQGLLRVRPLRLPCAFPRLEQLESRTVLYAVSGDAWLNPQGRESRNNS